MELFPQNYKDNVLTLRFMLASLMERQSHPLMTTNDRKRCKEGIVALKSAIEIIEGQIYA